MTIIELANAVAACFRKRPEIIVSKPIVPGKAAERYVPSTKKVAFDLNLHQLIDISDAIKRTIDWYNMCRTLNLK